MRLFLTGKLPIEPAEVLGGVFIARRELLKACRNRVLAGSGCTPEIAEILFELYLAKKGDAEGYISVRELGDALDYTPGLLSRRLSWLCGRKWAQTCRAVPDLARGIHGNCQLVRITKTGRAAAAPLWQKFEELAESILGELSPAELAAHYRISQRICATLSPLHFPLAEPVVEKFRRRETVTPPPAAPLAQPAPPKSLMQEPEQEFLD